MKLGVDVFRVGQIAGLFGIAPRTVTQWVDSGRLKGYRLPGSGGDRRVLRRDLVAFLVGHGMPVEELEARFPLAASGPNGTETETGSNRHGGNHPDGHAAD